MHLQVATSGEAVGGSRYRTLGRLGSGGMADLDLAVQTGVGGTSRLCVLKRVRQDLAGREEFVRMFFEEARISASLSHPNIVQVYEVGGNEHDCFLAMEFLRGRSYAHLQRVAAADLLAFRVDLEVLLATLAGLDHAHQRCDLAGVPMGLVHRDISPPNVLVTYEGEVKLLDFGVAKVRDSLVKTDAGMLKGKVAYMAPEMVAGKPFDARVDVYAVGVMLWEAIAGHDRWPGMNDVAILAQLVREVPAEPPGAARRGLPALSEQICARALAPDPSARYQTAGAMRGELLRLCEALGGRLGQSDLKDYMERHFAADRRREQREIDAALAQQGITPGGTLLAEPEVGGFTKRVKRPSRDEVRDATPPSAPIPLPPPAPKARGLVWAAVALVSLGAAIALKLLAPSGAPSVEAAAAGPSAEAPKSGAEPEPVAPAPSRAMVVEPVSPAGTTRQRPAKPNKVPAPATAKPASTQGAPLKLDRQDPWN